MRVAAALAAYKGPPAAFAAIEKAMREEAAAYASSRGASGGCGRGAGRRAAGRSRRALPAPARRCVTRRHSSPARPSPRAPTPFRRAGSAKAGTGANPTTRGDIIKGTAQLSSGDTQVQWRERSPAERRPYLESARMALAEEEAADGDAP